MLLSDKINGKLLLLVIFAGVSFMAFGQKSDTTKSKPRRSNIFQTAMNAITRSNPDDTSKLNAADVLTAKSEASFQPYEGKIIRNIIIHHFGFERSFSDTSKGINYFGTNILNALHTSTRDWAIRNNLFIRENTPLNAYIMADNERYLRTLDYIQDARLLVVPLPAYPDSVDIEVVTKDLFTLSGELNRLTTSRFKGTIEDDNILGAAQSIQFTALVEDNRSPNFGYQVAYTKNNLLNSFVNITGSYSTINGNLYSGEPAETGWYVRLDRPLVSPYSHVTGALTVGNNYSNNLYGKSDSLFYNYRYNLYDAWVGYNLGIKKLLKNTQRRDRKFVSLRYFKNDFTQVPFQIGEEFNPKFNDKNAVLGSFTAFKQNYYKANYVYGFGTTEDVPKGYNIALTGGWYKQQRLSRAYLGLDANLYSVTKWGDFIQYFARVGSFIHEGQAEDAAVLFGMSAFSRLLILGKDVKLRQYTNFSVTKLFNRITLEPLRIDNTFGLRYFRTDSLYGDRRASLYTETNLYLRYKLFGFQFAPFTFGDMALITPEKQGFSKSQIYYGLGGGVRTRNNNLVFGTMELRFIYFPKQVAGSNTFKVTFNTNLRFRFNSNYVKEPDVIQLNSDNAQNIY